MKDYFEVVVSYDKTLENGTEKKVAEHYIVSGVTFTDAEAMAVESLAHVAGVTMFIKDIKRKQYEHVSPNENASKWYECKVNFITLDEKSGAEKKSPSMFLVQAPSSDATAEYIKSFLHDSVIDWEIHTIRETKIVDLFNN